MNHAVTRVAAVSLLAWMVAIPAEGRPGVAQSASVSFRLVDGAAPERALGIARRQGFTVVHRNRLGVIDAHFTDRRGRSVRQAARALAVHPSVDWVDINRWGRWLEDDIAPRPNDPIFPQQWHLENTGQDGGIAGADIQARNAWRITRGNPDVVVAVLDSGVELNHEDLGSSIWVNAGEIDNGIDDDDNGFVDDLYGWDFVNGNNDPRPTESAHGTEVAGVVGARADNGKGVSGIAGGDGFSAGARIMALQVGERFPAAEALDDAVLYAVDMGAAVITMSLSVPRTRSLDAALEEARRAGVLVVCAAGNSGGAVSYPATHPDAFAVSGTTRADTLWRNSARGPSIDLSAPAVDIHTTDLFDTYDDVNGTSFASPLVAGVAALVASAGAESDRDLLKSAFALGARDLGPAGWDEEYGWGRVDARASIDAAMDGLGWIGGAVSLERRTADSTVVIHDTELPLPVSVESDSFRIPVVAGADRTLVASAYAHLPDTVTVRVEPGQSGAADFSLISAPRGTVLGTARRAENPVNSHAIIRTRPAAAHRPVQTTGPFRVSGIPADSTVILDARSVLRISTPETLTVAEGDTLTWDPVLHPSQDFDIGDGGMVATGAWAHGLAEETDSHTAPGVWGCPLSGGYGNDAAATLDAPPLLVGPGGGSVFFYQRLATEPGFDGGNLKISSDGGESWSVAEPWGGYPTASFPSGNDALRGEPGWSGFYDWHRVELDLEPWAGEEIICRWHFGSDSSVEAEGWRIDDFGWSGDVLPALDLELVIDPPDTLPIGIIAHLYAYTRNYGSVERDITLRWYFDGDELIDIPIGTIAAGDTLELHTHGWVFPELNAGYHNLAVEAMENGRALDTDGSAFLFVDEWLP